MFDSSVIMCDYSDDPTAKVERGEPIQVVRMVLWSIDDYRQVHNTSYYHKFTILTT